jgi:signal transduction histidine kinase/ligand-binding sensor domain-containing protein/CheY-like chemotaxis protein
MKRFACFLFILLPLFVSGNIYTPNFRIINSENGLSNNTVRCIAKDADGFIWFGTYDGLCRYDGSAIKTYKRVQGSANTLNNNHVPSILSTSGKELYIGTRKGLNRFVKEEESFRTVEFVESTSRIRKKSTVEVSSIQERARRMVVSTLGQGLLLYEPESTMFQQVELVGDSRYLYIPAMAFKSDHALYLSIERRGIYRYDFQTKTTVLITDKIKHSLSMLYANGLLMIGTNTGLYLYDEKNDGLTKDSSLPGMNSPVQFIRRDVGNVVWIGTESKGIYLKSLANGTMQHITAGYGGSSLSSEGVYCMFVDESGFVWIGTMRGGVEVWNPKGQEFHSKKNSLSKNPASNFINGFLETSPGILWLGTDGGGLQQYNLNQDRFETNPILDRLNAAIGNTVITMVKDKQGSIWFGTYGYGLYRYDLRTQTIRNYNASRSGLGSDYIWSLCIDSKGELWVGSVTGGGLMRYDEKSDRFEQQRVRAENAISLLDIGNGTMILGDFTSLVVFDRSRNKQMVFRTNSPVRALYRDRQNTIWVGTEGNGLMTLDLTHGRLTPANPKLNYLKRSSVVSIVEDAQMNLWIGTFNGLYRYHYPTEELTSFNKSDGIQGEQFNYSSVVKTGNGTLLFGGINGFTFFDPTKIGTDRKKYPLQLIDLSIHNASVFSDKKKSSGFYQMLSEKKLRIKSKDAYLRFDFIALSYDNPDKVQYSYMMEGVDKSWVIAGNSRSANYSALRPGKYRFKVRYAVQPDQWNPDTLELRIQVIPPVYRTWWAYLLYALGIGFLVRLVLKIQKQQHDLKQELMMADLKEEQIRQVQHMREQFFINISHELRTPLTLIIPPLKDSLNSEPYVPPVKTSLQSVYNNANRLLLLINRLLLFRKTEMYNNTLKLQRLDFIDFAGKVHDNFRQIALRRNISYDFKAPDQPFMFRFDPEKMEIILYNLLSNAFKYTPEFGSIELEIVWLGESELKLSVRDTGCGIPPEKIRHVIDRFYSSDKSAGIGIGLSLVKSYAELHHGVLTIQSKPDKGSCFDIVFDLRTGLEQTTDFAEETGEYLPSRDMVELVKIDTQLYIDQHTRDSIDSSHSSKPKILLVEDNQEILEYLKRIVLETGMFEVMEASNGKAALKSVKRNYPDIIISDIHMPEMDGIECCRQIKSDEETNHIYFILITADLFDETENRALQCGADEFITKPFDKTKVLNKIMTIFNYHRKMRTYYENRIVFGETEADGGSTNTSFIDKCIQVVRDNYQSDDLSPQWLAQHLFMSQSALYKKIKLFTGKSINEFIRSIKLCIASELILEGKLSISEIAAEVGIYDNKYFRECFRKQYGVIPSKYRLKDSPGTNEN